MEIDYDALRGELIRALRKHRSQERLSKALGFSFNQVHRWESGKTRISWTDFCRLCEACRSPIASAIEKTLRLPIPPADYPRILEALGAKKDRTAFAKMIGTSRFTVSRWLSGSAEPTLEDVLRTIQATVSKLFFFLSQVVEIEALPSVRDRALLHSRQLEAMLALPWVSVYFEALVRKDVPETRGKLVPWLAERVRMRPAEVERTLDRLLEAGLITDRNGSLAPIADSIDPSVMNEATRGCIAYWLRGCALGVEHAYPNPRSMSGFWSANLTRKTGEKIRKLYRDFWSEMLVLVAEDQKKTPDSIYVFSASLCDLVDIPELPGCETSQE